MEQKKTSRHLYLDAARCFAVLIVALNHEFNRTWDYYHHVPEEYAGIGKLSTLLKAALTVASHLGVPLFLMITGALLLRRRFKTKEDLRHFFRHNWLRLLITAEIWFFLGFWFQVLLNPANHLAEEGYAAVLRGLIKTLLFVDQVRFDSMWYVPMILTVYLMIPLFAVFLRQKPLRPALLTAALLFACFRRFAGKLRRWEKPLAAVSRSAFALYLLHVYPLAALTWFCDLSAWPHMAKVLLLVTVPLAVSGLVIWPLSKIPFFRKYVFLIK